MKKLLILVALVVFGMFSVGNAFELQGLMGAGAFVDYGIGMGEAFDDYEGTWLIGDVTVDVKVETSLGLSFGGKFLYGLTPNIALAALVDYQQIKYEATASAEGETASDSQTESWIAFNVNGMYFFNTEAQFCPYVEAGPGFYMPSVEGADSKFGINAGAGFLYMFQDNMGVDFGGRFHMIFTEDIKTNYIEIHGGIMFFFGGTE